MKGTQNLFFRLFAFLSKKDSTSTRRCIISKTIAWILILAILNLTFGCRGYYKVNTPKKPNVNTIGNFQKEKKLVIVHFEGKMWELNSIRINENQITGKISNLTKPTKYFETDPSTINRYRDNSKVNETWVLNEVHIHITEYTDLGNAEIVFPFNSVRSIQVYDSADLATIGSFVLGFVGITSAIFGTLLIIAILTKSSCPFIYVNDGEKYVFQGEIFSGSIYPQLERNDYMKLPVFNKDNKQYTLKISNEVKEIQHTNLCELQVFDHPEGMEVLIDKYGTCHSVSQAISPKNVSDLQGNDLTELVKAKDTLSYIGQKLPKGAIKDAIVIEFPKPADADLAKIVIRAKNTFVLDYMMGKFHDLFGDKYKKWQKKQKKQPAEKLRQWTLDQSIPLSLYIEKNGQWEFVDYYHIAGPMALKDDILAIPVDKNDTNPLKIKLEWGANFWEIDYVAADFSKAVFKSYTVPITTALTNKNKKIKEKLSKDDKKYYTQPDVGDEAIITFDLPALNDENRSIILHTKGHYQILRDPTGKPDISYLETFWEPGRFNRFCNEYLDSILKNNSIQSLPNVPKN